MWREVHNEFPAESRTYVNVATASHIKLKMVGDAWAVAVVHDGVESILEGTVGPASAADIGLIKLVNELNHIHNSNAITAKHQAEKVIESEAPKPFTEARRIR